MGVLSKICNKTGINQWTSNKKSQMSPETLANTGFTNLKSVHLDQIRYTAVDTNVSTAVSLLRSNKVPECNA